jgi:hypothetical protein
LNIRKTLWIIPALLLIAAMGVPAAHAQAPPPGYIWDVYSVNPGTLTSYTQFSSSSSTPVSFVADNASEYVSFAFRETPAYFAFDNAVVNLAGSSTNLLADPGFESASDGQNCNHDNSLGCPAGWGAWIQAIDTSAIGQVATSSAHYGCNVGAYAGTNFWCDGSVQGYDAVFQQLTGLTVGSTYDVSFWLEDDSTRAMTAATSESCTSTEGSCIDMLVYAGDSLPVGSIVLSTPEPGSLGFMLIGLGSLGLMLVVRKRISRALSQAT